MPWIPVGCFELTTLYFREFWVDKDLFFRRELQINDGRPRNMKGRPRMCAAESAKVVSYISNFLVNLVERFESEKRVISIWLREGACISYIYTSLNTRKEGVQRIMSLIPEEADLVWGDFNTRHADRDRHTNFMGRVERHWMS
jgi:hypothetical protein